MMDKTKNYEMGKAKKEEQTKQRKFEDILNKLTPQNFEELFEQVKAVNIDNAGTLRGVVAQIYDKALMEPTFCEMCANFCFHLSGELPDFSEDNEKITFKRLLINKCQEEFERGEREQEEANKANEEGEEREEKRIKARRRMLGNIRLIGELYKKKMLTERIMHECIKKLLDSQHQTPDEEDVEALCELMSTIGEIIDHPKAKKHMDAYFDSMETLSNHMTLSSRIRFMLKDTIDLRKNKWQQRKRVEGPKEIQEIHYQQAKSTGIRGSAVLFSPSSQLGSQNVHLDVGQPFEAIALSAPLTRRPVCDDASTSVSQGGISRVVSNRGSLSLPFSSLADSPRKDVILRMWLEELQEKSKAAIKEFYSTRDVEEVTQFIKESNLPSFHPTLVFIWITDSFEKMDMERDLLAKLLVTLIKSHADTLCRSQFIKGLESVLVTLENTIIDVPKAPEYLGQLLAKMIMANVTSLGEIGQLIHNGGEEPGNLVNTGIAADVLGNILESIRKNYFD